jgi:hypothetical protein
MLGAKSELPYSETVISRKLFRIGHTNIYTSLFRIIDIMTSQKVDLSSWDTLHRGINEFKKDNQPTNNLMKAENDNLLGNSHDKLDMCQIISFSY